MHIHYQKRFVKQMGKLQKHERVAVVNAIDLFRHHPFDPSLHNHPLIPLCIQNVMNFSNRELVFLGLRECYAVRDEVAVDEK